jgi:nickel/cobalt transporter (NicO) family protein
MDLTAALILGATTVAALHALAPDHWVPFAALARAERWSASRTTLVTAVCGAGHVSVSVAAGLVGVSLGVDALGVIGARLEGVAGLLLIGFGLAYGVWGLGRVIRNRVHAGMHHHGHHHHDHRHHHLDHQPVTARALFLLFAADPCVAVIPLMFAAVPLGWGSTAAVVAAYEVTTIGVMIALVLPARAAAAAVGGAYADRYGEALAGGVIALVGLAVTTLGI